MNFSAANLRRRTLLLSGAASVLGAPALSHAAADTPENYPQRPVKVIIPYTAGSIGDLVMRPVLSQVGEKMGQPFVVDNKPGASQQIGAELAARAAPDGYTLTMGTQSGFVLNALANKKLPFDALVDFAPITMLFTVPMYLFVRTDLPVNSVAELIALAKSKPGKLTFASIGNGTTSHVGGELFKSIAGIDLLHVPYKGGPEATNALVTGQVDVFFNGGNTFSQLKQGRVRVLASGGLKRTVAMPQLPTLHESGVPNFDVVSWFALFAPAGVPKPLIDRINREVVAQLKSPVLQEKFLTQGVELNPSTPEQLGAHLKADFPLQALIIKKAAIKAE
jgi:tripartite-type tricarboxylate transporter receptor subunit TctC